jgi:two-component system CheB/CheR fusion protein
MAKKKPTGKRVIRSAADEPEGAPPTPVETSPAAIAKPGLVPVEQPETSFPVVGIGASAGGLAAFEAFFSAMPSVTESGMTFVLVQHLAPDHKSILSDLVKRYTRMQVYEVEDGMVVKPNCAYIIPPNRDMAFLNGTLHLLEQTAPRGLRLPIDFFFRSLALDQHERAICIVLSGTGSDGTLGVRAVKGEGGMVMAQEPGSTEYDGMPRSAIATGLVDYVLPPAEMPARLVAYVGHAFGKRPRPVSAPIPQVQDTLKKVCILVRGQTGHDFSEYKESTIIRRVERRMAIHQIERPEEYLRYMQQNPAEAEALFRDLLIGVTNFFRDPEAFEAFQTLAIPRLFAGKRAGKAVRVWVCGCSTGEEAYSIAILIQEHMETLKLAFKVQIFATDVDRQAIELARSGVFPTSIAPDISPERLARFFILDSAGGVYRIHKAIRDLLVFSEQDVIDDPPFSTLDLISCRNLMIYMGGELQKKLISVFHYALNPEGVLFLGTSETVGESDALFGMLDRKSKLYLRRKGVPGSPRPLLRDPVLPPLEARAHLRPSREGDRCEGQANLRELTEQSLLQHFAQAGVLINGRGDILHIWGRTGKYLEPAPGDAGVNILPMAREGLRRELTTALRRVVAHDEAVRCPGLRVRTNGEHVTVNLTLRRVRVVPGGDPLLDRFLVVLEEAQPAGLDQSGKAAAEGAGTTELDVSVRIAAVEKELRAKEEYLQSTLQEMETSSEELKSANEEMQSVNEELQSTNEELETSKEELQSVNEELATVNVELQTKVSELSRANNDMNNLLAGTGVATLFVDHQLHIARFTPPITRLINLIDSDVGRPVGHIVSNLVGYDRLVEDVQTVLDALAPKEAEVQTKAGAWYLMRIGPYRTLENAVEGAVVTFVDITERKRMEEELRRSENRFSKAFCASPDLLVISRRADGRIIEVNDGWERALGYSRQEVTWRTSLELGLFVNPGDWQRILAQLRERGSVRDCETEIRCKSGEVRTTLLSSEQLDIDGEPCLLTIMHDITEGKRTVEALHQSEQKYRALFETMAEGVVYQDREGRIIDANRAAEGMLGLTADRLRGSPSTDPGWKAVHVDGTDFPWEAHPAMKALETGKPVHGVVMGVPSPGGEGHRWVRINTIPQFNPGEDTPFQVYSTFEDITELMSQGVAAKGAEQTPP